MPSKRILLSTLNSPELRQIADRFEVYGFDRRVKAQLVDILTRSRKVRIKEALMELPRNRLKELCYEFDLDDSGRRKDEIIERLTSNQMIQQNASIMPLDPIKSNHDTETSESSMKYEADLWAAANTLRGSMDAAEYKHVVLGLIFLKYISDAFEERYTEVLSEWGAEAAEDPDEYTAENIFWVPQQSRWGHLVANARQPSIGQIIDEAMIGVEQDNPSLKDVLPKDYGRPALDKQRLGQLIDLIGNISVGNKAARSNDVLGRVYEYFLGQFAGAEGRNSGEFYTPRCIVRLLVEMLEPFSGRVYDPCCGSSGMFVQSIEFIHAHVSGNNSRGDANSQLSIYGQESNYTTWRLSRMNLAIRGIEGQIAHGDSFHDDRYPDLRADYILANPPFNVKNWGGDRLVNDKRWQYGVPKGNANFAWVQHMVHHLAPGGTAGFVLANGSMLSDKSGEGEIRRNLVEANLVDCMIALPGKLFYSTPISACLWFLARDRDDSKYRKRRREILFIDARRLGHMLDQTHRELTEEEIVRIAESYHSWRDRATEYSDEPGFCRSVSLDELREHEYVLTPGRYVGTTESADDDDSFEDNLHSLTKQLREQHEESSRLETVIVTNFDKLGFWKNKGAHR